jgi:peroxiredoxin
MHTGVVRFRDHHAELARAGADVVGLSTQETAYEREVVEHLNLAFALVSDAQRVQEGA